MEQMLLKIPECSIPLISEEFEKILTQADWVFCILLAAFVEEGSVDSILFHNFSVGTAPLSCE